MPEATPTVLAPTTARARVRRGLGWATMLLPLTGLAASGLVLARGGRRARTTALGLATGAAILGGLRWQLQRWVTESPTFEVVGRVEGLELRRYPALVVAETEVADGPWPVALDEGFKRLAGYLFGGNQDEQRLAMTAPVHATVEPRAGAPTGVGRGIAHRTVTFLMPADRALGELPAPFDPRITLRELPARTVAVLRFRGDYAASLPSVAARELTERARAAGLDVRGEVAFAGYDPPSTLPWLRRNEVMIEVAGVGGADALQLLGSATA